MSEQRSHLYKKPDAADRADAAYCYLLDAMRKLEAAEGQLALSGYKGAARGIHQANERVKAWMEKVDQELKIVQRAKKARGEA